MDRVHIGNGCGFWGDNLDAPVVLAEQGRLDYLTLEYLAELTMSILALQKQRDPKAGFATDFLDVLKRLAPVLKAQPTLKIVTNAGGMNPDSCAEQARAILGEAQLSDWVIATVSGDDLLPRLDRLIDAGHPFTNLETGEPLAVIRSRVVSANAYLGAPGIVAALEQGASVVITGRVADASLTLAPAVWELGWEWQDWDRLSAATMAGHLIECGAQATGGLWCNWREADDMAAVGYPVVEIETDGTFCLTKPPNSGGAVNCETASEQLLYEVGDPADYLTPDVRADFTSVQLTQTAPDTVQVTAARGKPATDTYKVSIAYRDGFMASGGLVLLGPEATVKARKCGQIFVQRLRRAGVELAHINIECLGQGDCVPGVVSATAEPPEVVLRITAHDPRRHAIERFTKEFAPLVTAGLPGVTGYTTGRPPVREVFAFWPALISKSAVKWETRIHGR